MGEKEDNNSKVAETDFNGLNSMLKNLAKNLSSLNDIGFSMQIDDSQLKKIKSEVDSITNKFDSIAEVLEKTELSFKSFQQSLEKMESNFKDLGSEPFAGTLTTDNSVELIKQIFSWMIENETESLTFGREYLPEVFSKDLVIINDNIDVLPKFIKEVHQLLEELSIFIEYDDEAVKIVLKNK